MQDSEQTVDISSTPQTDAVTRNASVFQADVAVVPAQFARQQELALREAMRMLGEAEKFITGFAASSEAGYTRRRRAQEWIADYVNAQKAMQL